MPINHISKFRVEGLRGISRPIDVDLNKPLTLIYGENGTGKTSICDSLDFLGNGSVGSLSDISAGGQKHRYWPFLGSSPENISVYLQLRNGDNWEASTTGRIVDVTNSETRPAVKVWRRRQLIDLVLAKPSDRYSVIKPFIDVSEIDASENSLRELKRQTDQLISDATTRLAENTAQIEGIAGDQLDDRQAPIDWAREQLAITVEDVDDEIAQLIAQIKIFSDYADHVNNINSQNEINASYAQSEQEALQNYDEASSNFVEGTEETVDVLVATQTYLKEHPDPSECPVCASAENVDGLKDSIDQHLGSLNEFIQTKATLENAKKLSEEGREKLENLQSSFAEIGQKLIESSKASEQYPESYSIVSEFASHSTPSEIEPSLVEDAITNLSSRQTGLSEGKGTRAALETAVESYDQNLESLEANNLVLPSVDRCLQIHEESRKAYIDGVLASIAGEVGRLYEFIHPGEGLNQIALQLDPGRRASLDIQSEFLSQQVPPAAYFSNSHLDSLGLCILIAIAKLEGAGNTILVLDDILGSIDEPHVDRLVELLYQESANFLHTLVTTHYQAWHFKVRRGQLRNSECQLLELGEWSAETGATIRDGGRSLLRILEDNIENNPNEPEPIASNAGHLLEQLGDYLISRYECLVPKRRNGNTLNDYLNALKAQFTAHLRVCVKQEDESYEEIQLQPIIEELKEIYQVRNTTGAHYTTMAEQMPIADILRFGNLVVELGKALICEESGLPNRERNGTYWANAGETRRLYPLARP